MVVFFRLLKVCLVIPRNWLADEAEVVEILFSRGLVKVLFATETFAMVS